MPVWFWRIYLSVVLIALFAASMWGQNTSYQPDPGWQPSAEAAARVNPLAKKPQAAAGGKKLFFRECVECHGEDGGGLVKKHSADFQLPLVQLQSDGALFWKITNGNPDRGMPAFSRLPEMQRWQLVLFIRTFRTDTAASSPQVQPK